MTNKFGYFYSKSMEKISLGLTYFDQFIYFMFLVKIEAKATNAQYGVEFEKSDVNLIKRFFKKCVQYFFLLINIFCHVSTIGLN